MEPYTPTSDWIPLNESYYRKADLFELHWDVNLGSVSGIGAKYGGPLAISKAPREGQGKPAYRIYSNSGHLMCTVVWDSLAKIIAVGWSDHEKFVIVSDDYHVRMYNLQGDLTINFPLDPAVKEQGIAEAQIWGTGLVIMTRRWQFCVVDRLEEPRPHMLPNTGLASAPPCWCIVEPQYTSHGGPEILVSLPSGGVLVVDSDHCTEVKLGGGNGPFTRMVVSPTGKILATYNTSGVLWVVSTDFGLNLCEFNTRNKNQPLNMVWCGADTIVLYWEGTLLMVGPQGDHLKLPYEDQPHLLLVSEIDGLRVVTNRSCEFIQRVPPKTEQIFKIGSTHPAAMLYDAATAFYEKSAKADENIRYIRSQNALDDAVLFCIESATHDFSIVGQRNLLTAASFGKCFSSGHDPTPFVDACKNLRVVNAVRSPEIGMAITYLHYLILTPSVLIDRVINRHHHFVAFKICKFLKLRPNRVMIHWASCVVKQGRGDEQELCKVVVDKLQAVPGISYAEIASTAYKSGRPALATRLLDYEPRAADQIPLLISMKQDELALTKALDSGDTDLVYLVLLHSMRAYKDDTAQLFSVLQNKPVAIKLLVKYAWQKDPELLRQIFQFTGEAEREGDMVVRSALMLQDPEKRARTISRAIDLYGKSKTAAFQKEICNDEVRLLRLQMDLETSSQDGEAYVGLSVGETLRVLLEGGQETKAANFVKEFKIPETRVCWTKVLALSAKGKWDQLKKYAAESKKPPIGFAPFAEACFANGNLKDAKEFVAKIPEVETQAALYVRFEAYREAADCAHKLGDGNAIRDIRRRCKNKDDQGYIDNLLRNYK